MLITMFERRNCAQAASLPGSKNKWRVWEAYGGGSGGYEEVRWVPAVVALLAGPLRRVYTGVPLSRILFGLTCLDIKSAPSALNTQGPSVSRGPYWIGWALADSKWTDLLSRLFCGRWMCAFFFLSTSSHVCFKLSPLLPSRNQEGGRKTLHEKRLTCCVMCKLMTDNNTSEDINRFFYSARLKTESWQ